MKHLVLFIAAISLWACNSNKKNMTSTGYEYKFYTDSPGDNAKVGDYLHFTMDIMDDKGKVLQSYNDANNMPAIEVMPDSAKYVQGNPVLALVTHLSKGDSVGLFIPVDSIPQLPAEFDSLKYMEYRMVVKDVMSKEEHLNRIQAKKEALAAKATEISDFVASTLKDYNDGTNKSQVKTSPEGVQYIIHEVGTGPQVEPGKTVTMQYYGTLLDGTPFDNSFERGRGFDVPVGAGQVIPGWDKTLPLFTEGTKASIIVPYTMAYGEAGSPPVIPGKSDLYFYLEVEKVK